MSIINVLPATLLFAMLPVFAEEISIKQFEMLDGKKIQAQRYMMVKDGSKTIYQAKLLDGRMMTIKGEDVKEVTETTVHDDSLDSRTANRLKDEADNSQRTQMQRTLAAEKDKKITDEHTEMMREFINTQNELRRMKEDFNAKFASYSSAKAQIPVSKAAITSAESELRSARVYFQSALTVSELNDAKQRIASAEAKRAQHQTLLEQAQEAVAQLESPLKDLSADIKAAEKLIGEQKGAMQELKESRKSQPASNPLR